MSSLIVSLPLAPPTGATEWGYALTSDGHGLADHGSAPAALLPQPAGAGAEVVAVVPVQALSWHRVTLPKGVAPGTPRLRAALEGLLEEQLLDEAEAVHLALQPGARGGDAAWIAACDRAWLRAALQALEAAGRPASRIVPEFAPEDPPQLTALGEPEEALLVASSADGVLALPLATAALPLLPAPASGAQRLAEPAAAALAEQMLSGPWTLQQAPQRWLQSARSGWDLAQFEFASSPRARALKKVAGGWSTLLHGPAWRPARWAVALLLVANLAGLNAWAWKERASLDRQREAVRRALSDTFPKVRVIMDAPVQMEREVAVLRQQTGTASPGDLEALLAALASALPAGRTPSGLEYASGQLRAAGLGLSPDQVRALDTQLRGLGYGASADGTTLVVGAGGTR